MLKHFLVGAAVGIGLLFSVDGHSQSLNLGTLPGGRPLFGGITVPPGDLGRPARGEAIHRMPFEAALAQCRALGNLTAETWPYACADFRIAGRCDIILPDDLDAGKEVLVLAHERGHCNTRSAAHTGYSLPAGL